MSRKNLTDEVMLNLFLQELEKSVRDAVNKLSKSKSRRMVLENLSKYSVFLEEVQHLPPHELLVYWEGTFAVFNYLRRCGQLETKGEAFDPIAKKCLNSVINKLLRENL